MAVIISATIYCESRSAPSGSLLPFAETDTGFPSCLPSCVSANEQRPLQGWMQAEDKGRGRKTESRSLTTIRQERATGFGMTTIGKGAKNAARCARRGPIIIGPYTSKARTMRGALRSSG